MKYKTGGLLAFSVATAGRRLFRLRYWSLLRTCRVAVVKSS